MCHERWNRRREREAEEASELWRDFERATPIADPDPPAKEPEPTRAKAAEAEVLTADR
jgi:hypothetical protein